MKELPLAPMPGRGMETAPLEHIPDPEPEETAALETVWGELPAEQRRGRRDLLLPALIALQEARGWISHRALAAVCLELTVPLADAYGVASFYGLLSTEPGPRKTVYVCDDVACRLRGASALVERLEERLGPERRTREVDRTPPDPGVANEAGNEKSHDESLLGWALSPCLGQCDRAPAVLLGHENIGHVTPDSLDERIRSVPEASEQVDADGLNGASVPPPDEVGSASSRVGSLGESTPLLLRRPLAAAEGGGVTATQLSGYEALDGYAGLRRALDIGPEATLDEVRRSRLVGRGGAAFPTAIKWEAVSQEEGLSYVVCNADESEPGTFKDRILLEEDPFAILEGMAIAAWAAGAEKGYIYLRGEYHEARVVLERAMREAREAGYLGESILGTDFSFDIEMRLGAGAYVCGEETALFNSLEGFRGEPRARPPFPTQVGLFGRPTVINNVETLACVPPILTGGGDAYAAIGTEGSAGTKLVSISGDVARPGVYEVPFGVSVRTIIDELAGGVPEGRGVQAVLCGGAAGSFLTPGELDTPLSFEALRDIGGTVGSGAFVVYDEKADLWDAVERITQFFMDESCGQCVPCRVGTRRQWEWVRTQRKNGAPLRAKGAAGSREDAVQPDAAEAKGMLSELAVVMRDASICGLGQLAPNALLSALCLLGPEAADGNGGAKG